MLYELLERQKRSEQGLKEMQRKGFSSKEKLKERISELQKKSKLSLDERAELEELLAILELLEF